MRYTLVQLKKNIDSMFGELQYTQVSLNLKNSYYSLKIRVLGAKLCVAYKLQRFRFKESILVVEQKHKP